MRWGSAHISQSAREQCLILFYQRSAFMAFFPFESLCSQPLSVAAQWNAAARIHTRAFFLIVACASPLFLFIFVYTRRVRGLNSHSQGLSHCQFFFLVLRLRRCCRGNRVFCSDAAPLPRLMMTTADNSIGSKVLCLSSK
jgi:hypothetical protein